MHAAHAAATLVLGPFFNAVRAWMTAQLAEVCVQRMQARVQEWAANSVLGRSGFLAAFALIFLSEIGDKTFFIAALLAMKVRDQTPGQACARGAGGGTGWARTTGAERPELNGLRLPNC